MLYDMRVTYPSHKLEWYGPYELSGDDVANVKAIKLHGKVELRKHECDDPTESGSCGHVSEGAPAPY